MNGIDEQLQRLLEELHRLPGFKALPAATPGEGLVVVPVPRSFTACEGIDPVAHKRILLVDDNEDYRETLRLVLAHRGYEVYTAHDGSRGMDLALGVSPHLVITDFNMPRMNGYELVSKLRGHPATADVPMILFTGAANRRQLQGLHIDRCLLLEKPFRNDVLFDAVADFVGLGLPPNRGPGEGPPPPPKLPPGLDEETVQPAPPAALPPRGASLPGEIVVGDAGLAEAPRAAVEELPPLPAEALSAVVDGGAAPEDAPNESQLDGVSDSPLIARINYLLAQAIDEGASDIHVEPQLDGVHVRLRTDGSLRRVYTFPRVYRSRLSTRLKIMAGLVITERRLPQDGQIKATIGQRKVEFRVSTIPCQLGEKVVLRVLGTAKIKGRLDQLGLSGREKDAIERVLQAPHGLILVTGPTGSGKTTTLYTMLSLLNKPDVNLMTAEDPVEYEVPGLTQVQIKPAIGLTFEKVLRAFLRQDPDVLLLGEIRDLETAEIAIKASITGHLVLSTLHTNSAPATMVRLAQMGVPPYLAASSVRLVVAQRLVRLLCADCKRLDEAPEAELKLLTEAEVKLVRKAWTAAGCEKCHGTGYRGRMPLFEVMPVSSSNMRQAVLEGAGEERLWKLAKFEGMTTLRDAALNATSAGLTSLAETMPFIVGE